LRFSEDKFELADKSLLPYQLRGRLSSDKFKNIRLVKYYIASRFLPMSRKYVRQLLNKLNIPQSQTDEVRFRAVLRYHALSLQDCYWVRDSDECLSWEDVNLYSNSWEDSYSKFLLWGNADIELGDGLTPEMTTDGTYAKCWGILDGELGLFKCGEHKDYESRAEVVVSKLLDKAGVAHVPYRKYAQNGEVLCFCPLMTNQSVSRLSGMDFISYCNVVGIDSLQEAFRLDSESMYKMFIVDYLVSNSDRHGGNWGFLYDSDTMELLGCHPLYDHNNAFDKSLMESSVGGQSLFYRKSMKEVALNARKHVEFDVSGHITPFDFMNLSQYKSFKNRLKELK